MSRLRGAILLTAACCSPSGAGPSGQGASGEASASSATLEVAPPSPQIVDSERESFRALRVAEAQRRSTTDWRHPPDARRGRLGADPVAIEPLQQGYLALVRNTPRLLLLAPDFTLRAEVTVSEDASALAVRGDTVLVGSSASPDLLAYDPASLQRLPTSDLTGLTRHGIRGISSAGRCVYAIDEAASELGWRCGSGATGRLTTPRSPIALTATAHYLAVACTLGHALWVVPLGADGAPSAGRALTLRNDGPFFGVDAREDDDHQSGVVVAATHIEDHPLDRTHGSFGHVDSFLSLYRISSAAPGGALSSQRLASIDVSEHGVVTPKAIVVDAHRVRATGFGSEHGVSIDLDDLAVTPFEAVPGVTDWRAAPNGELVGASVLLDGFVVLANDGYHFHPAPSNRPEDPAVHLGEMLFFTNAMGPWQRAEGDLSRFTCETCHFEGGTDGRTHATGRGDIVATTKPLLGLANNGPHFTRALDEDLTEMVYAEFHVAAARSGHSEWFDLDEAQLRWPSIVPWYRQADHSPEGLRAALMNYLFETPHLKRKDGTVGLNASETRGAELFNARCVSCHAARLVTADAATEQPMSRWSELLSTPETPIVWASEGYQKTGVLPYVHPEGARPTSLRRVSSRGPYFTNGSALTLEAVLELARFDDSSFHAGGSGAGFSPQQIDDLLAFLNRL